MTQTPAREQALGALYAADARDLEEIDTTKISRRAGLLAEGVWERRESIDDTITKASTRWRIERMPAVDRNILRLGVYELQESDLSLAIVIDEAVELAKKFSTAKSGAFINGVLSAVSSQSPATGAAVEGDESISSEE